MLTPLISSLYDRNTSLPHKITYYHQAIQQIESHSISPQIYHSLKEKGDLERTPLFFQVRLKQKYDEALFQNILIKSETDKILNRLEKAKIEAIPLKGVYFAQEYFGHLAARGTSDIDILIKKESVGETVQLVKSLGFEQEEEWIPEHFHCSFSKRIPGSPVPLVVEIHWGIVKEKTSHLEIDTFWEEAEAVKGSSYIKSLSDEHTFYMICLHGWRHNLDSPRYYLDIIQLIFRLNNRVDLHRLFQQAKKDGTLKRMVRTLSIVYEEYPILENVMKLPVKRSMKKRRKGRLFHYLDFIDFQFLSYDTFQHCLREVYSWCFPRKTDIYTELNVEYQRSSYIKSIFFLYKERIGKGLKATYLLVRGANQP
ncbi:nucleotidyltransferase family protein [Rossellomorea aquimaris]|uniref:Putative nucleotidyltransferase-like protein n=1 Tax=Rossellomorea aquimaris TaxID=189382 RepID=A0A366ELH9_9BACI|nr:nucleotidyltransferase family protein [Rossellomorea aquimaris]RBP03174.1 putative nucleotidyltransferase-like protein [Rossellomorea aquimaris]